MNVETSLAAVVKELQSSNLSQDLILDTIDNYDFTLASNAARENTLEVPSFLDRLVNIADELKNKMEVLIRSNVVLSKRLEGNKLQEREDRGELIDVLKGLKPEKDKKTLVSKTVAPGGIFGFLGGAVGLLSGMVAGFIKQMFSPFFAVLKNSKLYTKVSGFFLTIGKFFDNIVLSLKNSKIFKGVSFGLEKITALVNGIKSSKLFNLLGKIFSIFGNSPILRTLSGIGAVVSSGAGALGDILKGVTHFFKVGVKIGGVLAKPLLLITKPLAAALKFLGGPFTLAITGAISGIMGAIKGFKEGGLIGGLKGFLVGAFDGLVGSLLDIVKDGISWIAGKLGFSEFSKFLDSFSFTELYSKYIIDPIFEMYNSIGKFIGDIPGLVTDFFVALPSKLGELFSAASDSIGNVAGDLGKAIDNLYKSVLRGVLPDPKENLSKMNPKFWVRAGIPDAVYEYAYSNVPQKNEDETKSTQVLTSTSTSERVLKATESRDFSELAKSEKATSTSERVLKATESRDFSELAKSEKAIAAGYSTWKEYKESNFKWKENITALPASTGSMLAAAGNVSNISPTIVVNNNNGGNTSNISTSNVNNNASPMMPILTGSALGY